MTAKNCRSRWILAIALCVSTAAIFATAQSSQHNSQRSTFHAPSSVTSTTIPASMFDMTAHNDVLFGTPWPTMPIYGMRLWDTESAWAQLNPSKGVYDWSTLDSWISAASANNVQLIYTFGQTPGWASSKPKDSTCDYEAGACDPPNDLNSDGTGTDQHFINFVTAIAQHAPSITYWEMWNTPHDTAQWTGTNAQLVRMVKDANTYIKKYIPGAKIISPANGQLNYSYPASNCTMPDKMGGYLAAGLGSYIDIMALHTYYTTVPEDIVPVVQCYQSTMKTYNVSSLPLWSTEGAWGFNTSLPSTVDQAGFVARLYLLLWSNGVVRHYWYAWEDQNTGTLSNNGVINSVGIAYEQVESWMSGRTMSTLCSENTVGIWTCGLTGSNGYSAQVVWHPGGNATYSAPSQYANYLDLSGVQHNITSATVTVGEEPILLQSPSVTQNPPDFAVSEPSPFPEVVAGGTGTSGSITISSENGFSGTVTLSCPSTFGSGSCSVNPSSVSSFPATATLVINGTSFSPGTYQLALQGASGSLTNSLNVPFSVGDFSIAGPASFSTPSSGQAIANLTLASLYSYSGQVTATCDASAISGAQCTLSPASPISLSSGASVPVTATVTIPGNATAGTYNVTVNLQGTSGNPIHSLTVPLTVVSTVQDFGFGSFSPPSQTISAGQSANYAFSVSPVGSSFPNAVTLSCAGLPALTQCTFTPNPVTPGTSSAAITMTIFTTANSSSSHRFGFGALLFAPWLLLPGFVFLGSGRKTRSRKFWLLTSLLGLSLLALTLTACSGATGVTNNSTGVQQQHQGTQPGTYPITVTGTSGTLTHQAAGVTLIVTQ